MTAIAIPRGLRLSRPQVTLRALRIWQRNRDVYYNIWRSELVWPFVEPLLTIVALGVGLADFVTIEGHNEYIEFFGPAMLAVFPMWSATAECSWGSFVRMDTQGTFDAAISTPVSVDEVTTGEIFWSATRALISVLYVMAIVAVFGGIESLWALAIIPFAIVPGLMFAAISLAYTATVKSVSSLNYFFATYVTPQFWLAGVFFPLSEMPDWVEVVAWFTPVYHVVRIYRGIAVGHVEAAYLIDLAWILVVASAAYLLAIHFMRRRLIR
ncbi:MAG TPA: ABC transporter permease [Dehalococcoidia bacterium]|nr:ABC transporter permease [Dehalococcoidia bacterium]